MSNIWFQSIRGKLQSWFTQPPSRESEDELIELPTRLKAELLERISQSPTPQFYKTTILEAIAPAVESWRNQVDAPNHLVILGSAAESIPKIINDSFEDWEDWSIEVIRPLNTLKRPYNSRLIEKRISKLLEPYLQVETTNFDSRERDPDIPLENQRKTLVLVPQLEQCFLRAIGGWSSIGFLRDIIFKNPNCFWVIGASHPAWNFLDFVCQISAYFDQIKPLPKLDNKMLADWLIPVAETLVTIDEAEDSSNDPRQAYWDLIAHQSLGIARVAQYLWLQSLRIHKDRMQDESGEFLNLEKLLRIDADAKRRLVLHPVKPSLPSLPSLTNLDRYLLHATLIHASITRSHLAQALGEAESQIQARVQWLSRQGILESCDGSLSIHPLYYDKLQVDLSHNNFFIGED